MPTVAELKAELKDEPGAVATIRSCNPLLLLKKVCYGCTIQL
eukprot:SAG31_NODE_42521_length_271_cov_0.604651_1_plen_41_part_01